MIMRILSKLSKLLGYMVLAVLLAISVAPSDAFAANDSGKDFCWKDYYGRGVGTVPKKCTSGYDRIGLLCYKKMPQGHEAGGVRLSFQMPQRIPQ
jgi:hypothetical protein